MAVMKIKQNGAFVPVGVGAEGKVGRGILEIKRTSGTGAAGTTDTYTIYYTDGTTSTFNVWNGINGEGGSGDGGENGATFTPYVDANGNLSWTNDKGLPNPNTVNIKGEKGEQGIQGEKGDKGDKGDAGTNGTNGKDGADGKTPIKGTDYFTASDKQELVNAVLSALPTWTGGSY